MGTLSAQLRKTERGASGSLPRVALRAASFAVLTISCICRASAQPLPEVAQLLQELIRIDTSNPPGREAALAELLKSKFAPLGFEIDIVQTPSAGKAHFIARLRGDGSMRPVLVAAHADVVGVEREKWTVDPFAGVVRDGYVYGRGAIDFKGGLAVFAQAVLNLARNKVPLARDVIFLSEADEEGGPYNTSWLAERAWDKMDCEFSLNEGGWIIKDKSGKVLYVSISTADKGSTSLKLIARGTSTHSSMPRPDNAIYTLSRALAKLGGYETKLKLTPETRQFFSTLAEVSPEPARTHFRNLISADPGKAAEADKFLSEDTLLHALMRDTVAPVLMSAGFRGNVIPGSAEVTINFRTIPGTTVRELVEEIRDVVNDPRVDVVPASFVTGGLTPEQQKRVDADQRERMAIKPSSTDNDLYRALARNALAVYPTAKVTPYLFQAGTDSAAWRLRGIPVLGIYPYPIDHEDLKRMHGNDERVPIASLESGVDLIYRTLIDVAKR
jgi:acetylornithine deacetylase/succinyl-diaminopimelate desuccinylase-like protein